MTHEERARRIRDEAMRQSITRFCGGVADLEELMLDMWQVVTGYETEGDCADFCPCYTECSEAPYCVIERRMAALGVIE